jgi:hypothetical protein
MWFGGDWIVTLKFFQFDTSVCLSCLEYNFCGFYLPGRLQWRLGSQVLNSFNPPRPRGFDSNIESEAVSDSSGIAPQAQGQVALEHEVYSAVRTTSLAAASRETANYEYSTSYT